MNTRKGIIYGIFGLFVWGLIFVGLRLYYSDAPLYKIGGVFSPGLEYIKYNLSVRQLPILLFQTFGILPLVGWFQRKRWHAFVRLIVVVLVPVWLFIHVPLGVWAETRIFLVLVAIVVIPSVLSLMNQFSCLLRSGPILQSKLPRRIS